jgi:hypothetical protein
MESGHGNLGKNTFKPTAPSLSIFPNPAQGSFTPKLSSPTNEEARVTITNILGEKIKELTINTNKETPVQLDAPAGIYFISGTTNNENERARAVIE